MTTPPGDKLVRPVNAPDAASLIPGVQAGTTSAVVVAQLVIVGGSSGGIFAYLGTPGPGTLAVSITGSAGTDPFGNTIPSSGINIFPGNSTILGGANLSLKVDPGSGQVIFNMTPGATVAPTNVATIPQLIAALLFPGTASESQQVILSAGTETGQRTASLTLTSATASGSPPTAQIVSDTITQSSSAHVISYQFAISSALLVSSNAQFQVQVLNAGMVNESNDLALTSAQEGASRNAVFTLMRSESADGTIFPLLEFGFQAASPTVAFLCTLISGVLNTTFNGSLTATSGTVSNPTLITTDSWHAVSMAAGWSTLATYPVPSYRLEADGQVSVSGLATHAAFAVNTALSASAVPAAYRPLTNQFIPAAEPGAAGLLVDTSGNWTATTGAATGTASFTGRYPVNL